MIGPTAPFRIKPPKLRLPQSTPFISPHARIDSLAPKTLRLHALPSVSGTSTGRRCLPAPLPRPQPLLPASTRHARRFQELLATYAPRTRSPNFVSPFHPVLVRSSKPSLPPSGRAEEPKERWRPPLLGLKDRELLCRQAFLWRLAYAAHASVAAATPGLPSPSASSGGGHAIEQQGQGSASQTTLDGWTQWAGVTYDPVPTVIAILGGSHHLTAQDKRWLGLEEEGAVLSVAGAKGKSLSDVVLTLAPTPAPGTAEGDVIRLPKGFGRYEGLGIKPPFRGSLHDRKRPAKVAAVREKMSGMQARVETYRKELKESKAKAKPSLPF